MVDDHKKDLDHVPTERVSLLYTCIQKAQKDFKFYVANNG